MSKSVYREIFRLGWPVFIGQVAVVANGVIDTIMAGRYSTVDLAGVGVGAAIYFSIFIALMGVLLALTPIASQLYGANRYAEIGEEVRQSAWLAVGLGAACFALLRYPDLYMALTRLPPEVEERARGYLAAASWGVPAALLFRVFYGFSTAVSRPRVVMALNLIGLAIKIPLNLVFMYGRFGAPELGGVGCAVSSSVAGGSFRISVGPAVLQRGQRSAHFVQAAAIDVGHHHAFALGALGEHLAPRIDDHGVAVGAPAARMPAPLRRRHHIHPNAVPAITAKTPVSAANQPENPCSTAAVPGETFPGERFAVAGFGFATGLSSSEEVRESVFV